MSSSKKLALAGDVLFYLKSAGIDIDYEEALELAGSLLDDGGWDIAFQGSSESTSPPVPLEQDAAEAALALRADELAQKVVDAVKAHLEAQDCTDQRGHRFIVEYPPKGQWGLTRTFCEWCGVKP